jgi:hypothetical protein
MEDEFEVPEAVQDAADAYSKALTAANKAKAKFNGAKEAAIEAMREEGIDRVRIQTDKGEKWLTILEEDKLKLEKIKKNGGEED